MALDERERGDGDAEDGEEDDEQRVVGVVHDSEDEVDGETEQEDAEEHPLDETDVALQCTVHAPLEHVNALCAPSVHVGRRRVLRRLLLLLVHRQVDDVLADGVQVDTHVGVRLVVHGRRGPRRRRRAVSVRDYGVIAILFR